MVIPIKESIGILKLVQEIDRQIYQATLRLEEIPAERDKSKRELEAEKSRLQELDDSLKKSQLVQKNKEGELAGKEAQVRKLDGQLSQVKTNKEYSALQQEIASLKADNSILEEEIIKILDEVEAAEDEVKKGRERLKAAEKNYQTKDQALIQEEGNLKDVIEREKKKRGAATAQLDPEVKNRYDLVVEKKQGIGLTKVVGENCGACQMRLRPQLLNELKIGESLVFCESCSRILYMEEEESKE